MAAGDGGELGLGVQGVLVGSHSRGRREATIEPAARYDVAMDIVLNHSLAGTVRVPTYVIGPAR